VQPITADFIRWGRGWAIIAGLLALPHVVAGAAGFFFMWREDWLLAWAVAAAALTLMAWALARLRVGRVRSCPAPRVRASVEWPPRSHAAWEEVEAIAQRAEENAGDFDRFEKLWPYLRDTVEAVAAKHHPNSQQPLLETPTPYVFRIAELVARDVRVSLLTYVPGSHLLTMNDIRRLKEWAGWAGQAYRLYRFSSFALNPAAAALRELRDFAARRAGAASGDELRRWGVGYMVRRAGYYAIQLYSGALTLEDEPGVIASPAEAETRISGGKTAPQTSAPAKPTRVVLTGAPSACDRVVAALTGKPPARRRRWFRDPPPVYELPDSPAGPLEIVALGGFSDEAAADRASRKCGRLALDSDLVICAWPTDAAAGGGHFTPVFEFLCGMRQMMADRDDRTVAATLVAMCPDPKQAKDSETSASGEERASAAIDALEIAQLLAVAPSSVAVPKPSPDGEAAIADALFDVIRAHQPHTVATQAQRERRQSRSQSNWRLLRRQASHSGRLVRILGGEATNRLLGGWKRGPDPDPPAGEAR